METRAEMKEYATGKSFFFCDGQKWFAHMKWTEDTWLLWSNGFTVCWISQKRWHLELIAALMTFNVTPVQFPALGVCTRFWRVASC